MSQHTPEPWVWTPLPRGGGLVEDASGDLLIADLLSADNAHANGPLLAKAPELLKALREIAALQPEGVVDEWSEAREFHHAQEIAARALVDLGDV